MVVSLGWMDGFKPECGAATVADWATTVYMQTMHCTQCDTHSGTMLWRNSVFSYSATGTSYSVTVFVQHHHLIPTDKH